MTCCGLLLVLHSAFVIRTEQPHGASGASRIPGGAEGGAEIHEGLVERPCLSLGDDCLGQMPEATLHRGRAGGPAPDEDPGQDPSDIRVQNRRRLPVGKADDGTRRVPSYPGKGLHLFDPTGKSPPVTRGDRPCCGMEISCASVVPQPLPRFAHVGWPGLRQILDRRILTDESLVIVPDPLHLSLLKHDLGDEDPVRVPGPPPGQIAAVPLEPAEQPCLKRIDLLDIQA